MEFIKLNETNLKKVINVNIDFNCDIYALKDQNILGYGLLKEDKTNLYIYVKEEFRGNGYGTKIFNELLDIIRKKTNYNDISLAINKEDMRTNNIIKNNGGIEVSKEKDCLFYIIPLNK